MRTLVVIAALAIAVSACGDDPLAGVGDVANEVIHQGTTTTYLASVATGIDLVVQPVNTASPEDLAWLNEELEPESVDPREVLSAVWDRGRGVTSGFVQAGPAEIAVVLPDLQFPGSVPLEIQHISSQLVFEPSSGLLNLSASAAFGMWSTIPYSVGRSSGQLAVLTVGQDPDLTVAEDEIVAEPVEDGIALVWQHAGYTYELFCRDTLPEAACREMAASGRPLRTIDLGT